MLKRALLLFPILFLYKCAYSQNYNVEIYEVNNNDTKKLWGKFSLFDEEFSNNSTLENLKTKIQENLSFLNCNSVMNKYTSRDPDAIVLGDGLPGINYFYKQRFTKNEFHIFGSDSSLLIINSYSIDSSYTPFLEFEFIKNKNYFFCISKEVLTKPNNRLDSLLTTGNIIVKNKYFKFIIISNNNSKLLVALKDFTFELEGDICLKNIEQ